MAGSESGSDCGDRCSKIRDRVQAAAQDSEHTDKIFVETLKTVASCDHKADRPAAAVASCDHKADRPAAASCDRKADRPAGGKSDDDDVDDDWSFMVPKQVDKGWMKGGQSSTGKMNSKGKGKGKSKGKKST